MVFCFQFNGKSGKLIHNIITDDLSRNNWRCKTLPGSASSWLELWWWSPFPLPRQREEPNLRSVSQRHYASAKSRLTYSITNFKILHAKNNSPDYSNNWQPRASPNALYENQEVTKDRTGEVPIIPRLSPFSALLAINRDHIFHDNIYTRTKQDSLLERGYPKWYLDT